MLGQLIPDANKDRDEIHDSETLDEELKRGICEDDGEGLRAEISQVREDDRKKKVSNDFEDKVRQECRMI